MITPTESGSFPGKRFNIQNLCGETDEYEAAMADQLLIFYHGQALFG
jgi:hypothetical protein